MPEMILLMEHWREFLREQDETELDQRCLELRDAEDIVTIGQLQAYFQDKDPGTLKKLAAKYGGVTAKILGITIGAATGGAGAVASSIAGEVVQQMLQASIMAFADLEDGSYAEGTAGSYFDLDDKLTLFLRHLETQGGEITQPAKPEQEVFTIMKKKIETAVHGGVDPCTKISQLLKDITAQSVLDTRIKSGEYSGAVEVTPIGE